MIIDSAIYVDGHRIAPSPLEEIHEACRERGGFAWIGLYEPTEEEFESVAGEFGLHAMAVKDAIKVHQRPKIERYGETLFAMLTVARYTEKKVKVVDQIDAFVGSDFVITVSHDDASRLNEIRQWMEGKPELLRRGPTEVFCTITRWIVDDYHSMVDGLTEDIDKLQEEVLGDNPSAGHRVFSRQIYLFSREVIKLHQAVQPLARTLERLTEEDAQDADPETRKHLRDVRDHVLRIKEQIEGFRELLTNILSVNLTFVGIEQNDQMKKISAWAAVVIVPTLIAGIYGMNFDYMPELHWRYGYLVAISLMALIALTLYLNFKKRDWL